MYSSRGTADPDSDVDFAVTVDGGRGCTPEGNYIVFKMKWEGELSTLLKPLKADVNRYDDSGDDVTKRDCDECSSCSGRSRQGAHGTFGPRW